MTNLNQTQFTLLQKALGISASLLVRSIRRTLVWEQDGLYDCNDNHWSNGESVILACWHSQQLFMPWIYRYPRKNVTRKTLHAIVSRHGDGRLAASLLEQLSINTIPGSSSNGGARALVTMRQCLKDGNHVAITPDGPKGPAQKAKLGAVKLASLTGVPIVPIAFNAKRKWTFNSWDSLFIPKPFSRAVMIMGDHFNVKPNLSRVELEEGSLELTTKLDRLNAQILHRLS